MASTRTKIITAETYRRFFLLFKLNMFFSWLPFPGCKPSLKKDLTTLNLLRIFWTR